VAHLLGVERISHSYPNRHVLSEVSLGIADGDRIGVVGRNGDGKSTLLSIVAGTLRPDSGQVTMRSGLRVGMLRQTDLIDEGDTIRQAIVGDVDDHVWAREARIRDVVNGLVADLDWSDKVETLSGGQRRRVALAALLVGEYDVLILDEPTNHLDVEGVNWLADHLRRRWPASSGALLVVTHDRWFLDEVSTDTWEVHDAIVEPFEGGYAAYVLQRVERDRITATAESRRQNLLRKELAWLRRGAPARTTKPKFRVEAANQLIAGEPAPRDTTALHQLAVARLGRDVLDVEDAAVSFDGGAPVFRDVTWRIGAGDRFALLGANGAGKTTLLRLLTRELTPDSGRVKRGVTVRVATLSQALDELEPLADKRVADVLAARRTAYQAADREVSPAQLLERLGFTAAHLATPVRDLSGGQRRRLQLLLTLLDEPNVLILDEPTNDMDTDMLVAIEDLLDSWPGTLIVASHDRYLLERVTDNQYALIDGRLRHVPGGLDQYLELVAGRSASVPARSPVIASSRKTVEKESPVERPAGTEMRQLRKRIVAVERSMGRLTEAVAEKEGRLAVHDPLDYNGMADIAADADRLRAELARLEEEWLTLSAEAEG
jgi:ABC transport system ATP-binding/permease protein